MQKWLVEWHMAYLISEVLKIKKCGDYEAAWGNYLGNS